MSSRSIEIAWGESLNSPWSVSASQFRSVTKPRSLSHLLNDVPEGFPGRLEPVPQPCCLKLYDAEGGVQFMGEVVNQPPSKLPLGFQGEGHPVEGLAHLSQLIPGRHRQQGRVPLGDGLSSLGQAETGAVMRLDNHAASSTAMPAVSIPAITVMYRRVLRNPWDSDERNSWFTSM